MAAANAHECFEVHNLNVLSFVFLHLRSFSFDSIDGRPCSSSLFWAEKKVSANTKKKFA